ncbi:hypothetical protein [Actinoplanes utahensis]|uniref:hypothetical protein n=1 Tax=Actinoplanes utahensis TaxID=1869 RepID=UPI000AD04C07|nr:hypothetical protein [Actinoplanes utahensis]GIF32825.1 hypothetical protein Aut01nite_58110 [Actinoplanes utahensis]
MSEVPLDQQAPPALAAHWALRSKRPGVLMSYEILAGDGDERLAEELIRAGVVGNPEPAEPGRPDEYPWLAFVPGRAGAVLACVQTTWTEQVDGTGQPIAPARVVYLPYADALAAPPTCRSFAAAFLRAPWPGVDSPPAGLTADHRLPLALPALDVRGLAEVVQRRGFQWAATAAAVLVDGGSVAVVADAARFPGLEDRLDALDAVLALLPYWYRAELAVATWTSPRARHGIRLGFTTRAGAGQTEMRWDVPAPAHQLATEDGRQYLKELFVAVNDETVGLTGLIGHLAGRCRRAPRDVPVQALEELREVRFAELVRSEIRQDKGDPQRVGQVLARGWDLLDGEKQRIFTGWLADCAGRSGDPGRRAIEVLRRFWHDDMSEILFERVREDLAARDARSARGCLSRVAAAAPAGSGTADRLFQRLLHTDRTPPDMVVELLLDPPAGVDVRSSAVAAGVLRHDVLIRNLVGHLLRTDADRAIGWIRQLDAAVDGRVPAWFRPFLSVAEGDPGRSDPRDYADLAQRWKDVGSTLFELALRRDVPAIMVSESLWPALIQHVKGCLSAKREVVLPHFPVSRNGDAARADLAHLAASHRMPYLAGYPSEIPMTYLTALAAGWNGTEFDESVRTVWAHDLVRDIPAGSDGWRWRNLCAIGDALADGTPGNRTVTALITAQLIPEVQRARPRLLSLSEDWDQRIRESGQLTYYGPLLDVSVLSRKPAAIEEIAHAIREAGGHGAQADELVPMIATWVGKRNERGHVPGRAWRLIVEIGLTDRALSPLAVDLARAVRGGMAGPELTHDLDSALHKAVAVGGAAHYLLTAPVPAGAVNPAAPDRPGSPGPGTSQQYGPHPPRAKGRRMARLRGYFGIGRP